MVRSRHSDDGDEVNEDQIAAIKRMTSTEVRTELAVPLEKRRALDAQLEDTANITKKALKLVNI